LSKCLSAALEHLDSVLVTSNFWGLSQMYGKFLYHAVYLEEYGKFTVYVNIKEL